METRKLFTFLVIVGMIGMFLPDSNAQRGKASLTKSARTQIIDSILSGDMDKVKALASANPQHAPGIAALYAKHSGARGKQAGKIAAEMAKAIGANGDEASEIVAAIAKKTQASLEETADIMASTVGTGLPAFTTPDDISKFVALTAIKLGLKGRNAGKLVALFCEAKGGCTPEEAGKIGGVVAKAISENNPELNYNDQVRDLVGGLTEELKADVEDATIIAAAVATETGVEIAVQGGKEKRATRIWEKSYSDLLEGLEDEKDAQSLADIVANPSPSR